MTQTPLDRDLIDRLDAQDWRGVQSTMFRLTKDQADKLRQAPTGAGEPVGWQRRLKFTNVPGGFSLWEACSKNEATGHFERQPGYEYRPIFASSQTPTPDRETLAKILCFSNDTFKGTTWDHLKKHHVDWANYFLRQSDAVLSAYQKGWKYEV